jgi:hypothetical protein
VPRKTPIPVPPPFDPAEDTDPTRIENSAPEVVTGEVEEPAVPEPTPIRAMVAQAADHHLIVGMATLANMNEDDFRAKLDVMKRGLERVAIIQRELMKEGVDYGKVPGIARPFLHQPGAEMLSNLYGFAVRQEAERIVRKVGDDPGVPPYAFVTKSFVHLGDFDGPIVATGSGEANPYETKYHERFTVQGCPVCGRPKLIKRVKPPALAGKWQCPGWGDMGGCGTIFEPNDPRLAPTGKEIVPDTDLWGLAETILAMSAKRSLVASVRRATGTSGLFTQDEDSPSVQSQSARASEGGGEADPPPPVVESATLNVPVAPGGKTTQVTQVQLDRLKALSTEKGLNGAKIAELLTRLFGMTVEATGRAASEAVRSLTADQLGNLLAFIDAGDLSTLGRELDINVPSGDNEAEAIEANVAFASAVGAAIKPDDIGAK